MELSYLKPEVKLHMLIPTASTKKKYSTIIVKTSLKNLRCCIRKYSLNTKEHNKGETEIKQTKDRKQKEKFHSGLHDVIDRNPIISIISRNVSGINNPTKREMIRF